MILNTTKPAMRAVQLDLARQMETLEFIQEFIDFAKSFNYNTIFLYLEARVRTKSFPYPTQKEAYSPEEMKIIVNYAQSKKIDLIPVVGLLGHAELFFKYPQMQQLSELRNGATGRFGSAGMSVFCPSQEETYTFIENYLIELSEIFPSEYFHAGCDESWDIGICEQCLERVQQSDEGALFAEHLCRLHEIITGALGKKMIIWGDMFELYPNALDLIPKDIIMDDWHYDLVNENPVGYFCNLNKISELAIFKEKGFKYISAPAVCSGLNIASLTDYAANYNPLGFHLTIWETADKFLWRYFLRIAFAGNLWNEKGVFDSDEILHETILKIVGENSPEEIIELLKDFCCFDQGDYNYSSTFKSSLSPLSNGEYHLLSLINSFKRQFTVARKKFDLLNPLTQKIVDDIILTLDYRTFYYSCREIMPKLADPRNKGMKREKLLDELNENIDSLIRYKSNFLAYWELYRKDLDATNFKRDIDNLLSKLKEAAKAKSKACLRVDFCQPNQYSAQQTRFSIKFKGEIGFTFIDSGVYKMLTLNEALYSSYIPIDDSQEVEGIKVESSGYGSQGISYVKYIDATGHVKTPSAIKNIKGKIRGTENILRNNSLPVIMGYEDVFAEIQDKSLADETHSFELILN